MDEETHQLEEFKHIGSAILEIDKRILQILTASTAVAAVLLSAIGGFLFGRGGRTVSVIHAYAALAPNLLTVPAFYLILSQRIDMMRLGSYRLVFFEEKSKFEGWETRLQIFRKLEKEESKESNDPVPWIFWGVFWVSALLFFYAVFRSGVTCWHWHLWWLAVPAVFIGWAHYKWRHVVCEDLRRHVELWRKVATESKAP